MVEDEIPQATQPAAAQPAAEQPVLGSADGVEVEGEEAEDDESENLPFPNARVVKIVKSNLKNQHQIKRDVKVGANMLLGEILTEISQTMDQEPYFTLSVEHFNKAARKYKEIGLNQKRIRRIKKVLEKQRAELDEIIAEIEIDLPGDPSTSQ